MGEGVTEKLVWHVVKEFANVSVTKGSHLTACVGPALAYVGGQEASGADSVSSRAYLCPNDRMLPRLCPANCCRR
jgi:hypothetical protein